jgi:hypothetical protein
MLESSTNGAGAAEAAAAGHEDQGGVAELGFVGVPGTDVEIGGGSPVPGP